MPGTNLTREEAQTRARLLDVESYTVDLDLTAGDTSFDSTTVIRFSCREPGAATFADLVEAQVHAITLNGRELDPATTYAENRVALDDLAESNELTVVATCPYSRSGEGLHRFVDPADGRVYTYTQFEVPDARRVYTTFEQPDLKALFTFTVTAPEGWVVASNAETPEPTVSGTGTATWAFPSTERLSTYVTAIVAGEYHTVYDTYDGPHGQIRLGHLCRQSMAPFLDVEELLEITKQGFAYFEEAFGFPYPFGHGQDGILRKYDQAYVPEYNMGAMENAGCITFRDEYLPRSRQTHAFFKQRANTVLHEMAHMWFGDLVTMRWWDDLWLNESFAEWASHHAMTRATKYTDAWTGFTNARKNWAYRQDQLPSTHPIAADNHDLEAVEVNFDGITYAKGASTLKQLVAWVGEEEFHEGLRSYFVKHQFGNSEFTDLLSALEASSGRDLASWAEEWLQTCGVNTLRPEFEVDDEGRFTSFAVRQTAHPDFPTLRRHRIGVGLYDSIDGRLVRRPGEDGGFETDIAGELTELPAMVGRGRPDLVLLNDHDLTYAKIRLDHRSLATLVSDIDTLDDSLARALCWGAAWDMTRDAEMTTTDFTALVLRGIGTESDLTAVGALLRYAKLAIDTYAAPENRATLLAAWEQGLASLVDAAAPGSDHQLAFVRAFASAARSDAALDRVQSWYDGSERLDGLTLDPDLRWGLLTALAARGRAGEATIAAELQRDNTISGQESAAAARTVLPTAEAKERAWEAAVVSDTTANETQRQIAGHFQVVGQDELLQPYVDRYLEVAQGVWEAKGVQRSTVILTLLFPRALPTRETLDRVQRWLDEAHANPAAVRYVREGAADLQRALAAQERDARG
ncbi:MAG: aminopeptidase [Nocardioidaceae bacterium]|nr:aminopeptidase [Nocardioidaceae bacterium]